MPPAGESAQSELAGGRGRLWFWLKIAVSIALLGYLFRGGDLGAVRATLAGAEPLWVAAAFGVYLCSHLLNAFRWHRYVCELGFSARKDDFLRLYFVGLFVNLFAPGTIAGDIARGIGVGGKDGRAVAFAGVVAHRLTGLVALLLLAGIAALVQGEYKLPPMAIVAAVAVPLVALCSLLAAPRLVSAISPLTGRSFDLPSGWAPATGRTLVLACCYHALQIASMILLARALDLAVAPDTLALFVPVANAAGMIPVTVSGIGVREAVYVVLLGTVGVSADAALALGLLGSGLVVAAGLAGAPAFLMPRPAGSRSERG